MFLAPSGYNNNEHPGFWLEGSFCRAKLENFKKLYDFGELSTLSGILHSNAIKPVRGLQIVSGRSLTGKKKVFRNQFSQKSPRALHVLNHGWWRLAVGGWWWLAAVGGW